jgi:hypothetical protein
MFSYWFAQSFVTFQRAPIFEEFLCPTSSFHVQDGGSRPPETVSCYQTTWKHVPWHSNVHNHVQIQSIEKLIFAKLINKFPLPYGTRRFITVFTTASHNFCSASVVRTKSTLCSLELVVYEAIFVITVHRYFPWPSKILHSKTTVQKGTNLVWQIIDHFYY